MYEALRKGATVEEIFELTKVKTLFYRADERTGRGRRSTCCRIKAALPADDALVAAKKDGFSDKYLSQILEVTGRRYPQPQNRTWHAKKHGKVFT